MSRSGVFLATILSASVSVAQEPQPLTNADILALLKGGLGSAVITTKIVGSASRFDTSTAALVQLKAAGVPDDVLVAMLRAPVSRIPSGVSPNPEEQGVSKDDRSGAQYRSARGQESAEVQFNRGMDYFTGRGLPRDFTQAALWFREAADQGNADAQSNLSVMYANGYGVPRNYVRARMWANIAAAHASSQNLAEYARLQDKIARTGKMTTEQLAEAQRLAHEWTEESGRQSRLINGSRNPEGQGVPNPDNHAAVGEAAGSGTLTRWMPSGERGSSQAEFLVAGKTFRQIETASLSMRVALESAEDPLRIVVVLANKGAEPFDVLPEMFSLTVVEPKEKAGTLLYLSPEAIAKQIGNAAMWAMVAEGIASMGRSMQGTTTRASGTVATSSPGRMPSYGAYNGVVTTYDNTANQQLTRQNMTNIAGASEAEKLRQTTGVILPNTVFPGATYGGVVHFKREKRAQLMTLRLPIGGQVFEFPIEMPKR